MSDFVDQNIIEVVIADRAFVPDQPPAGSLLNPAATEHFRFNPLLKPWSADVKLFEIFLNRIQVHGRSPLQSVTRKQTPLASDATELHELEAVPKLLRQFLYSSANIVHRHRVDVSTSGILDDEFQLPVTPRFMPDFRCVKLRSAGDSGTAPFVS